MKRLILATTCAALLAATPTAGVQAQEAAQPAHSSHYGATAAGPGKNAKPGRSALANLLPPGTIQTKLVVTDLDKSAAFYSEVLGATQAVRLKSTMNRRPMDEVILKFPNGDFLPLVLIKYLDGGTATHEQVVIVFFTDDIDALIDRVERNGGRVTERRDDPKHRARIAFWYDPEGNLVETVQMD